MTGCRIASEDRGDPHFDGFDEDGYDKPTRRERLENLLEDIQVLIDELYELMARLDATSDEVLFIGDALQPGGNDYPVKRLGVATSSVEGPDDTVQLIQQLLAA